MFRCDNCGSGYSSRMASVWESCPRCLAKDKISAPLSFELGWRGRERAGEARRSQPGGPSSEADDESARGAALR